MSTPDRSCLIFPGYRPPQGFRQHGKDSGLKKISAAFTLLAALGLADAAGTWTNGTVKVQNILWRPDVKGFYATAATFHSPSPTCVTTGTPYYVLAPTLSEADGSRLLSMLLTAKSTDSALNVWVDGCHANGPYFTGLQLNP